MSEFSEETQNPEMAAPMPMSPNDVPAEPNRSAARQIVTEIVSAIKAEEKEIKKGEQTQRGLYFNKIATLHRFVRDLKSDEALRKNLIEDTSITLGGGGKWELFTVKLAYKLAGKSLKKQTVSEHAQVLIGLREAHISHETEAVSVWLGQEEALENGRTVSGRDKALLYAKRFKAAQPPKASAEAMKKTLADKREKKFAAAVEPKLARPLGSFDLADDAPTLPEGFASALVKREGGRVVVVEVLEDRKAEVEKATLCAWAA